MTFKISMYLLFVALPLFIITSFFENNEMDNKNFKNEASIAKAMENPQDGAILGSVIAPNASILIKGINDRKGKVEVRGKTDENGEFFINGFDEGTYTITIEANKNKEITTYTFNDVEIAIGEVTALGTVTIE